MVLLQVGNSNLGYITRLTRHVAQRNRTDGYNQKETEERKTPCHAKYQPLAFPNSSLFLMYVYVYAHLHRLKMEMKLFLLATLGLTGDALCGIGGGFGMGELADAGRGEPDTFLSMPFKLLLRLSSPFGVPIGVGGSSLFGGGGFSLSSSTGDVALATNAGPGWEVSDTADCDRF